MTAPGDDGPGRGVASEPLEYPAWLPTRQPSGRPASGRRLRIQGEETVSKLVDSGRDAFSQLGYSAARVDDIVELAGTSHGTFYLYFRNKEDLLHRLAIECGAEIGDLTRALNQLPVELAPDSLEPWLTRFFAAYRRHSPVIRVWMERRELDPLMQALANDTLGGLAAALQDRLHPDVAGAVDPSVATLALLSLIERMAAYVVAGDGDISEQRAVRTTAAMVLSALRRSPAVPPP